MTAETPTLYNAQGLPIQAAAPTYGTSRGYVGADPMNRVMRGWFASAGSADDHTRSDLATLRKYSGDAYRNMPVAAAALRTPVTNIVGPGLTMQSHLDHELLGLSEDAADDLQDTIEREWRLWAESKDCDATRSQVFAEQQSLALLSALMNGDCFAFMPMIRRRHSPYALAVQLVEAHQITTPDHLRHSSGVVEGLRVGRYGETTSCFVMDSHPGALGGYGKKWREVPFYGRKSGRRNVIHLAAPDRIGQKRSFPYLSSVLPSLKQISRLSDAELMAAVVTSFLTIFIKSDTGAGLGQGLGPTGQTPASRVNAAPGELALGHGNIIRLAGNESIETPKINRPNEAFDPFFRAIVDQLGGAIGQPGEIILHKFGKSYSASRAALLMAWKFYSQRRAWLVNNFCQPIFEEWFHEAVLIGRIKAPGFFDDAATRKAYCRTAWNGPTMGQLDPLKEVNAAAKSVENDFSTREEESLRLHGADFDANLPRRIREEKKRRLGGLVADATQQPKAGDNA